MTLKGVLNVITTMPAIATPITGTRLWVGLGVDVVSPVARASVTTYAPKPRRTQVGVDLFHNSTGVSAPAERRLR